MIQMIVGLLYSAVISPHPCHITQSNRQIVYDLRAQKLSFVAPIPEQIGTSTMHFSKVSGVTY